MEILLFDLLPSTQIYLIDKLKNEELKAPVSILAYEQNSGIGSRDNRWSGGKGNFFASIAIEITKLPKDLPLASASIYFSYIMKKILLKLDTKIWLKWPNDFYIESTKIGGTITKKIDNILVCGIGINLKNSKNGYEALQCDISPELLLDMYLTELQKYPNWKQVFSEYKVEFELSRKFYVHIENNKKSLLDASLCDDGSLILGGKKVYSLR
ncbi:MAG: biotin--[acetyl-CoA-carboxylase] ligase [Bacteroidales bacterium]|nr:biotin--[acetyl-CoA-carboxylase] ligase [Bacteroidales bacterium]